MLSRRLATTPGSPWAPAACRRAAPSPWWKLGVCQFVPERFDGDLLFFAAKIRREDFAPLPEDWRPHVSGRIDVHEADCQHQLMMEPVALAQIGPALAARLEELSTRKSEKELKHDQPI